MSTSTETRLQVVFRDLRNAVDDVILKHQITLDELSSATEWLVRIAEAGEMAAAGILFIKPVLEATEGVTYAHPEKDGASHWEMEGEGGVPLGGQAGEGAAGDGEEFAAVHGASGELVEDPDGSEYGPGRVYHAGWVGVVMG